MLRGLFSSCDEWGYSSLQCMGFSLRRLLWLRSADSRAQASVLVACGLGRCCSQALEHRPRCSKAYGIFLDGGPNPCLLRWQADSLPLSHQGSKPLSVLVWFYWPRPPVCRVFVPQPEIEPGPMAVKARSPNHWTTRELPTCGVMDCIVSAPQFIH